MSVVDLIHFHLISNQVHQKICQKVTDEINLLKHFSLASSPIILCRYLVKMQKRKKRIRRQQSGQQLPNRKVKKKMLLPRTIKLRAMKCARPCAKPNLGRLRVVLQLVPQYLNCRKNSAYIAQLILIFKKFDYFYGSRLFSLFLSFIYFVLFFCLRKQKEIVDFDMFFIFGIYS